MIITIGGCTKKICIKLHIIFYIDLELFIFILYYFQQKAYSKGLEDAGISDPQALDKNYWIQRVGEVNYIYLFEK